MWFFTVFSEMRAAWRCRGCSRPARHELQHLHLAVGGEGICGRSSNFAFDIAAELGQQLRLLSTASMRALADNLVSGFFGAPPAFIASYRSASSSEDREHQNLDVREEVASGRSSFTRERRGMRTSISMVSVFLGPL